MADLPRPVTRMTWAAPAFTASSTISWMVGGSTIGSISFGTVLVTGRKRVPSPAAGMTTLRSGCLMAARTAARGADPGQGYTVSGMRWALDLLLAAWPA